MGCWPDRGRADDAGNIVTGILVSQLWSVAGQSNRPDVSSALFQPFFNYNLKGGWALSTAPIITAKLDRNAK